MKKKTNPHYSELNICDMSIYIYNDVEVPDGIPRIIDDDTFEQA